MTKVGIIGFGVMGQAIASSLISSNLVPQTGFIVVDRDPKKFHSTGFTFKGSLSLAAPGMELLAAETLFLCVKPQDFLALAEQLRPYLTEGTLIVSVLAGTSLQVLSESLGSTRVIRCMPNLALKLGLGVTGYCCGKGVTDTDVHTFLKLAGAASYVFKVAEEDQLDVVTATAGSGPGFIFSYMEQLEAFLLSKSFAPEIAKEITRRTFFGAATLAFNATQTPAELRAQVASKGGTTQAGLEAMKANGVDKGLLQAFEAATERARQLRMQEDL